MFLFQRSPRIWNRVFLKIEGINLGSICGRFKADPITNIKMLAAEEVAERMSLPESLGLVEAGGPVTDHMLPNTQRLHADLQTGRATSMCM